MTLYLNPVPLPTGGAVAVTFTTAESGTITLSRSPYPTISWTVLYTGEPLNPRGDSQFFLDLGDGSPGILIPITQYIYELSDNTGTITSAPITPVANVNLDLINWDQILIKLLQGAVSVVQLPTGVKPAQVVHVMPLSGLLPMPFIVVLNEMEQQQEIPIGQSNLELGEGYIQPPYVNISTQTGFAENTFRVSIFSQNAAERQFYRELVIATFRANFSYVFQQLGSDIEHRWQAVNYQATKIHDGQIPGFYASDIMLEFKGTKNVTLYTNYGIIKEIDVYNQIQTYMDTTNIVTDLYQIPGGSPPVPTVPPLISPFYLSFSLPGTFEDAFPSEWDNNYELFDVQMPVDVTFGVNFAGSPTPGCQIAAALTDVVLTIWVVQNQVAYPVGYVTYLIGSLIGSIAVSSSITVLAGNRLRLTAPVGVDRAITGIYGTFVGYKS